MNIPDLLRRAARYAELVNLYASNKPHKEAEADAIFLLTLADRLEKPTEEMVSALLKSIQDADDEDDFNGAFNTALVAAIAAAGEGL